MAFPLGVAAAVGVPWDTPGVGDGSTKASWTFDLTVDGQNTCGNAIFLVEDTIDLSIDDCINLRESHSNANSTGTYIYSWNTPGNVPADTYIYGPYYGDCMVKWIPFDYTQSFTIGSQDVYDIVDTAIGRGKQTWATLPCEGGSGQPIIIEWEVASIKANPGSSPGPGPYGNIG